MEKEHTWSVSDFFERLPLQSKQHLPVNLAGIKEVGSGMIRVDTSKPHHTDHFACYWFYKPISQLYKTFEL